MAQEIGKLIHKSELQTGTGKKSGKPWQKMTFVIQVKNVQFERKVAFDTFKANVIEFINDTSIDSDINVDYSVESREYQGRWYTNCNANGVEVWREDGNTQNTQIAQNMQMPPEPDGEDSLPF